MQLRRGTVGNVGHHWRTKCALSGYHGGKGNGLVGVFCSASPGTVGGGVGGKGCWIPFRKPFIIAPGTGPGG